MRNNTRKKTKGFTLVELVVVIAIVAILGAVSVVGYFAFIEKANKSVDEQLCTQYNTILKAASVEDNDITLPEVINLIEENGINANYFETKSKDYIFAYNRASVECVLLKDGQVAFPKGKTVNPGDLWASLDSDLKFVKGVGNYATFSSFVYSGNGLDKSVIGVDVTPTIDLNNHSVRFASKLNNKVEFINGTVINKVVDNTNVDTNDTVTTVAPEKAYVDAFETVKENVKAYINANKTGTSVTIDGLCFAPTEIVTAKEEFNLIIKASEFGCTDITFKNCVVDRITVSPNGFKNVTAENCKFFNLAKYTAFRPGNLTENITFKGNTIIDCKKSAMEFYPATNKTLIEGNEITMSPFISTSPSSNGQRKDMAFMMVLGDATKYYKSSSTSTNPFEPAIHETLELKEEIEANLKVTIKNNIIHKAKAFLYAYNADWREEDSVKGAYYVEANDERNLGQQVVDTLVNSKHFEITGNKVDSSVLKVGLDYEHFHHRFQNETQWTNYATVSNALEALIK